jgi:hypothetical protein
VPAFNVMRLPVVRVKFTAGVPFVAIFVPALRSRIVSVVIGWFAGTTMPADWSPVQVIVSVAGSMVHASFAAFAAAA